MDRSNDADPRVPTHELQHGLEDVLSAYFGERTIILSLHRYAWPYRSSFALESLTLEIDGRSQLSVMFKDLSWQSLSTNARLAKTLASYDPLREISVYQQALSRVGNFAPRFFGSVVDRQCERYWLFIEQVRGRELYQIGDFASWIHVARCLAKQHASLRRLIAGQTDLQARLIRHGPREQEAWFELARQHVFCTRGVEAARRLSEMSLLLPQMAEALAAFPATLIHGEFYPSNVLIDLDSDCPRVCAVDWEMAGWGTGLLDLASLVVGRWSDEQQFALAKAYWEAANAEGEAYEQAAFFRALRFCRLYVSLRWLGWSDEWQPPAEHSYDWLFEALKCGDTLKLQSPIAS
jgi:Ser/Thr protein kinase RdoA (MazF antagonist)